VSERNVSARNLESQELLEEKRIALAKPKIGTTTGNLLSANDSTLWSSAGRWIKNPDLYTINTNFKYYLKGEIMSENIKSSLTISAELFEFLVVDLTSEEFNNYLENGFPDSDDEDREEEFEELEDKLSDSPEESGISFDENISFTLSVNGEASELFNIILEDESNIGIRTPKKWTRNENCIVQVSTGASGEWQIDFEGEFDVKKLTLTVYTYELPDGSSIKQLYPLYDEQDFEFQGADDFSYVDYYLVDEKGIAHQG